MIRSLDSLVSWLGDFYLLSTVLLAIALAVGVALRQPAKRLAVIKATFVALGIVTALCALPRYSVVHLRPAEQFSTTSNANSQAAAFAAASNLNENTKSLPLNDSDPLPPTNSASNAETASAVLKEIGWQRGLVVAYIAGAVGVFVWLIMGQLAAVRLRRLSHPAPAELVAMLKEVATRSRVSPRLGFNTRGETGLRPPKLLVSNRISAPVALGLFHPVILVPKDFTEAQPEICNPNSAVPSILAHELAHIRNRDLVWLAVSRILLILLWAQPLYWLVRRRMRFDQETLADVAAAELTTRQQYAEQLVAWARTLSVRPRPMRLSPAVGLWEGASQLRQRITILLNDRLIVFGDCSRAWRAIVALLAMLALLLLSLVTIQKPTQAEDKQPSFKKTADTRDVAEQSLETTPKPPAKSPHQTGEQTLNHISNAPKFAASEQLEKNNFVKVTCVDGTGKLQENVSVELYRVKIPSGTPPQLLMASLTGSEGSHTFGRVVRFDSSPWHRDYPNGQSDLSAGVREPHILIIAKSAKLASTMESLPESTVYQNGVMITLTMQAAATLKGRVVDVQGKPISGAQVTLNQLGIPGFCSAITDNAGGYDIADAAPLDWPQTQRDLERNNNGVTINVWKATAQPPVLFVKHSDYAEKWVPYGRIPGQVDVSLDPAGKIKGRIVASVTDTRQKLFPATVICESETDEHMPSFPRVPPRSTVVQTDIEGNFVIGSLKSDKYSIWCDAFGWFNPGVNSGLTDIAVRAGETTNAPDLIMDQGTVVHVQLVDAASGKAMTLQNQIRGQAIVVPEPGTGGRTNGVPISIQVNGRFDIRMPSGRCGLGLLAGPWEAQPTMGGMFTVPKTVSFDVKVPVTRKTQR